MSNLQIIFAIAFLLDLFIGYKIYIFMKKCVYKIFYSDQQQ